MMKIYNTMSRKKEEFKPIKEGEAKIYVCGPTVYNFFHIGNARPFVVFDTLRRYMEYTGFRVTFVQNFTDVDDKIINRAKEDKMTAGEVSEKYIKEYFKDTAALNIKKATVHPKVTENMDEIIKLIEDLIHKGYAYEEEGDVYYSTRKFSRYGKLSNQNIDDLEAGARIMIEERKHDPLDFALWKKRKEEGEIAWESPWGLGRPGWHIECSAMSKRYLGETIDIHAGGQDLQFPHHENEIAQSEAHNGCTFANYWMHNGYITIDDEKMSKSAGNFFTVRDILKDYKGEVIRYFLLSAHYRNPINFNKELMEQAKHSLARMENAKENLEYAVENASEKSDSTEAETLEEIRKFKEDFNCAMDDDLNTADAIAAIFQIISLVNNKMREGISHEFAIKALETLTELTSVLGLLQEEKSDDMNDRIKNLIEERQNARAEKNFVRADEIRDILKAEGITLKDTPQGVQIVRE